LTGGEGFEKEQNPEKIDLKKGLALRGRVDRKKKPGEGGAMNEKNAR